MNSTYSNDSSQRRRGYGEVKWFSRPKGYGFLADLDAAQAGDIFIHLDTLRQARFGELTPGEIVEFEEVIGAKGRTVSRVFNVSRDRPDNF